MAKRSTNSTKNFPSSPQSPFGFGGIIGNLYWNITFFSLQSINSIELSFLGIKGLDTGRDIESDRSIGQICLKMCQMRDLTSLTFWHGIDSFPPKRSLQSNVFAPWLCSPSVIPRVATKDFSKKKQILSRQSKKGIMTRQPLGFEPALHRNG